MKIYDAFSELVRADEPPAEILSEAKSKDLDFMKSGSGTAAQGSVSNLK